MNQNITKNLKHRVHHILYGQHATDRWVAAFDIGMATLIILNVIAIMLETVAPLYSKWQTYFTAFELFSVAIFSLEYAARLWVADLTPQYQGAILGRIRYMLTPGALIDLAAILPSLLLMSSVDLRFLRIIRLFRILRLLRLPHYNQAFHSIIHAAHSRRAELQMALAIMFVLLIISSSLVYFAEHDAQPEAFSSIPASLWWGMVSLTTIGYGDVYPVTSLGKLLASFFSLLGIGFVALPSGILASALIEQAKQKNAPACCPHCGGRIGD